MKLRSLCEPEAPTHPDLTVDSPPIYEQGDRLPDLSPRPVDAPRDWRIVPLPHRMRDLPRDRRGFPIFYTVTPAAGLPDDGAVDFARLNMANHIDCHHRRRCAICYQPLTRMLHFLGGPMCIQRRIFGDGAMHYECAQYARQVCPFLANEARQYDLRPERVEAPNVHFNKNAILTKPERLILYATEACAMLPVPPDQGQPVFLVQVARWVEWYMPDGTYLCRTRPTRYAQ